MSTLIQRSFAAGEIAPALYARVDQVKYASGLRTCRNHIVMRHGGATNRAGTIFVGEVKDSTKTVRMIPFVFNAAQTYILEFGDLYMRVNRAGSQVLEAAVNITGATQANPCVITAVAHGYATGQEVYISGVLGMTTLNGRNFKIIVLTADTFSLKYMDGTAVNSTAFTAYASAGTVARVYTIVTPYAMADLPDLRFVQSADVITIVHPSYAPRELSRTAHTSWTLAAITFAPAQPAPTNPANNGAAGATNSWVITAINTETREESLPTAATTSSATPSAGAPIAVTWTAAAGATEYNIYRAVNGLYGFIGSAVGASYSDVGATPDTTDNPPEARNPFPSANNYPSCVTYYQQRLTFGNTNTYPEKIFGSRSGQFKNYTISQPTQDDQAITFSLAGKQVNSIKHLLDLGKLIAFTDSGELSIEGDSGGTLTPSAVNPRQHSYSGSGSIPPLVVGGNAIFVQARGSIVRDLGFDWQVDGYRGNDLTIFSAHLFDGYSLADWTYQQIPHSIVWAARSDGTLLGVTYIREQQLLGWHRHDFDGTVENVCAIPEGDEDSLYLVIKRTINGATKRYIERMETRQVGDIVDSIFSDCSLSYDGRNTAVTTMTLSGSGWTHDTTLTLTASAGFFTSSDVGNQIVMTAADGTLIRCVITAYTSALVVTVRPQRDVPADLQAAATTHWSKAIRVIGGLWHLEGKSVSVLGDGLVFASPNNDSYQVLTVANGQITLDKPASVLHVGLPVTADLETLNLDSVQGETMSDKNKLIGRLTMLVEKSRGIFGGPQPPTDDDTDPLQGLNELKIRGEEGENYDEPVALQTGTVDIRIEPSWNDNGRVFIRQVDPLPLTVLAIAPAGYIPAKG